MAKLEADGDILGVRAALAKCATEAAG